MSDADPMATEDEVERQRRMAMVARTNAQNNVNQNFANANTAYDQMQQRSDTEISQRGAQNNVDAAAQAELRRIANRPIELRRQSLTQAQASQGADDQWRRAQVDGYFNKVQSQRTMMQEAAAAAMGGGGGGGRGGGGGGGGGGGSKSGDAKTIVGDAKVRQSEAARNLPKTRGGRKAKALGKQVLASAMPGRRKKSGPIVRGKTEVKTGQKSRGVNDLGRKTVQGIYMHGKNTPVRVNIDGKQDRTINEYFGGKGIRGAVGRAVETNARRGLGARREKTPGENLFGGNEGIFGRSVRARTGMDAFDTTSNRDRKIAEADQQFADADEYLPPELQMSAEQIARQIAVDEYGWDPIEAQAEIPDYYGLSPYQNAQMGLSVEDQEFQRAAAQREAMKYQQSQEDRNRLIELGIDPALGVNGTQTVNVNNARMSPEYAAGMQMEADDPMFLNLDPAVQAAIRQDRGF